jgi:ubiquinone/menaquinone biosynthesis C-methylase UbiE
MSNNWDTAAADYDYFIPVTGHFAKTAQDHLFANSSQDSTSHVLDLACGTGVAALMIAENFPKTTITGADYSPLMIETMNQKAKELCMDNRVKGYLADGQDLNILLDDSIDAAISISGLIFFPERKKGWRELYRVLKPGGIAAIGAWVDADALTIHEEAILGLGFSLPEESLAKAVRIYANSENAKAEILEAAPFSKVISAEEHWTYKLPLQDALVMAEKMFTNAVIQSVIPADVDKEALKQQLEQVVLKKRVNPDDNLCYLQFTGMMLYAHK